LVLRLKCEPTHHFGVGDNLSESEGAGPPDFE
jgi:hypothetical protein